ncbi:MBL fold metallo-hydrolase [Marivirga atlantica]|uniref:MBL fold metallo-hydrolase n=1 Tax=Marivirga atlantica TaxID=1548457 RepID=A0A937AB98_9BACT|nr:MBL fold metallo-hydrolase [Marivirga atlantica]MBL0765746.1 MBL fold metallo-hydrolase [Marivirga atlantica]
MKFVKNLFKWLFIIAIILIAGYYMVKYLVPSVGKAPKQAKMEQSPYYQNGKFQNVVETKSADFSQMPGIIKEYINRKAESAPSSDYVFQETNSELLSKDTSNTIHYNWLGHAAILMEKKGKYILLDPMLGKRASPFSFMGPKRYSAPPISAEDLPELEAVIYSHDHYDHLDYETIVKLTEKTKYFYVPLGVAASLESWGIPKEKIKEFSWWDQAQQDHEITITATPARHFSGRLFSQNNTFWASWVIQWDNEKVYFGGDTGIFDGFAEIDQKLGPFDMALLPIGAYNEAWHDIHMDPKEAVEAYHQLRTEKFFPIHWGTFDLALHSWYEPIQQLVEMSQNDQLPLITLPQGEWFSKNDHSENYYWWKKYSNTLNQ